MKSKKPDTDIFLFHQMLIWTSWSGGFFIELAIWKLSQHRPLVLGIKIYVLLEVKMRNTFVMEHALKIHIYYGKISLQHYGHFCFKDTILACHTYHQSDKIFKLTKDFTPVLKTLSHSSVKISFLLSSLWAYINLILFTPFLCLYTMYKMIIILSVIS